MKLLFLDTNPVRRGSQVFIEELADALIDKGIAVKKVYLYEYNNPVTVKINDGDILLNAKHKHVFEKFPTVQPAIVKRLIQIVNDYQPNLILLNGSRTLKYASFAKPFFKTPVKLVYRIIDSVVFWNRSVIKKFYYKHIILKNIDAAIGVSQASLNDVKKLYDFKKSNMVIHRSFNSSRIDLSNLSLLKELEQAKENKFIILFLANLTEQKRPDIYVNTIHELYKMNKNIKGWIVGDGKLRKGVEQQIKELNLQDVITIWGYQKNVFPFIKNSNILLLTSDTEGLPGVTLEAGYFNVPTVCSNVGGVKEFIVNDSYGFVLDKNNSETYAFTIQSLISQPKLLEQVGINAKDRVIANFDMQVISSKYINFFQQLINS